MVLTSARLLLHTSQSRCGIPVIEGQIVSIVPRSDGALTDEYLREYSREHLWYEISMLFHTGRSLPSGVTSPVVDFVINAVLESFAIHLRNLLDFFYPENKPRKDDVVAVLYFDSCKLPLDFPAFSDRLREARIRAHKQVSHLTTRRIFGNPAEKAWHYASLLEEMQITIHAFIRTASKTKLHPDFFNLIEIPNPTTVRAMQAAERGEGVRYNSVDELFAALNMKR